jgi:hypothetical protein
MTTTWSHVLTSGSRCGTNQVNTLLCEIADELQHSSRLSIHPAGRFVEEQQIGVSTMRLRELDALLSRWNRFRRCVTRFAEADVEQHPCPLHVSTGRPASSPHATKETAFMPECARRFPACSRRARIPSGASDVEAEHAQTAAVGHDGEPEERLDHRLLPAPLGAQQAAGTVGILLRHVAQRTCAAVGRGHPFDLYDRIALSHSV